MSGGTERDTKKSCSHFPEPRCGPCPVACISIFAEGKWVHSKALVDSGATCFVLSNSFVSRFNVPKVKRDDQQNMRDASHRLIPSAGHAFTQPVRFRFNKRVFEQPCEIMPMSPRYDMILPDWWIQETSLAWNNNGEGWEFKFGNDQEKKPRTVNVLYRNNSESEALLANTLTVDYDESILVGEDLPGSIGTFEMLPGQPIMNPDCSWREGKPTPLISLCAVSSVVNLKDRLPAQYHQYLKLFEPATAQALPKHRSFDHAIDLEPGAQPPWGPVYALSEVELQALREYLDEMLRTGKIRPSKSPAGAPILFVPKAHGRGLRLCVDYRGLNKVTIKNRYPLPLMGELRDRVQGSRIFSKIDLKSGYNLIRIKEGDEWKTAFRTRYGHYEYLVMPFGLTNAPATFQAMMNDILREFLDLGVVVYIDDILIYSKTEEEHEALVKKVLQRLQEEGLAAEMDKCVFHTTQVDFLGYVLSTEGVFMSNESIQTILDWEAPCSVKDVQVFMGFANFYRRFVRNFSGVCKPITDTLKGDPKDFRWTQACQVAFEFLKAQFTKAPVLRHFDPQKEIFLETDASDFAIAGVLSQKHEGRLHPVAFFSRKFIPAEVNYEVYDKEMLAIVQCFIEWRHYLEGARHQITVFTDHKNLEYFATSKVLNRRQARWAERLSPFDFKIIYRKGEQNGKADALSRRPEYRLGEGGSATHQPILNLFKPGQLQLNSTSTDPVISTATMKRLIQTSHLADALLDRVRSAAKNDEKYLETIRVLLAGESKDKINKNLSTQDNLLWYDGRLFIPEDTKLRLELLENDHDSRIAGHWGQDKTLELMTRNWYWPKMDETVNDYVRSCDACQRNKSRRHKRFGLLQPLELAYSPWTSISMDFITELPTSAGCTQIWVIVDRFTKMAHFIPLKTDANAEELARVFVREIWRLHGLPENIVSDRDAKFTSAFWSSLMKLLDIKQRLSTSFHPETDGQTERVNQSLEQYLRSFCSYDQKDWWELLPLAEYAYNNSVTNATGQTPFYSNYGYNPKTTWLTQAEVKNPASEVYAHWIEETHKNALKRLEQTRDRMAKYFDAKRQEPPGFKKGDKVMLDGRNLRTKRPSKKLDHKLYGPFKIIELIGNRAARLQLPPSMKCHNVFHFALLEPYRENQIQGRRQANPDPVEVDGQEEYVVESIIKSEWRKPKRGSRQSPWVEYLVKWKDYSVGQSTFETVDAFEGGAEHILADYHRKNPEAPRDPSLDGNLMLD